MHFLQTQRKRSGSLPSYSAIYLKVKAELGPAVCRNMFFLHAILGCDTTSRPYGTGKAASLKKYVESVYLQDQLFDIPGSTQAEVATAGENALVVLYGGKQSASIAQATAGTMKTWQPVVNRDSPRTSPRHPQQPDTTALGSFYESNSGIVLVTGCSLKTGAGSLAVTR